MQKMKKLVRTRKKPKLDVTRIYKFLRKQGLEDTQIRKVLLSMLEFLQLDFKRNEKILLENLKGYFFGEIMGS